MVAAAGVGLLALSLVLNAARAGTPTLWTILAAIGAALLLVSAITNARTVVSFFRRRNTRRGADSILATVFMAAILVVVQATSVQRSHTFDLTRNHRHTLAPQTIALLDSLDRDVEAVGFFRQASVKRGGADELLSLYARRSAHFRYSLSDPDRQPDRARRMDASLDEIVLTAGNDHRIVRTIDEEGLTNALVSLTREGARVVYFVTGHGEKDIAVTDREGYSAARERLEGQGYHVRTVSLLGGAPVPTDAAVLVIAGPRQDYFADEIGSIERYLAAGGSLLCMVDARVATPQLAEVLARYHLSLLDAVVLDALIMDAGDRSFDATVTKVRRYEPHPITRDFNFVTLFVRARPVMIASDSTVAGLDARYLAITDDASWGEVDESSFAKGRAARDGDDLAGPLPIAAAAKRTPMVASGSGVGAGIASRVVLIGDSDFAGNAMLGVLGNTDFFLNVVAFLSEDEHLIRIRPRRALGESVYITERQGRMVFLVCLVLLPLTPVVAGAVVVARRRRL